MRGGEAGGSTAWCDMPGQAERLKRCLYIHKHMPAFICVIPYAHVSRVCVYNRLLLNSPDVLANSSVFRAGQVRR